MGTCVRAELLVRDEFNTAGGPDYANGIYQSGKDLCDSAGNATCEGGTIIGYDSSSAWTNTSTFIDAYANLVRLYHRTYSGTYTGRPITTALTGKTNVYAKATIQFV